MDWLLGCATNRDDKFSQEGKSKAAGVEDDLDDLEEDERPEKPMKTTFELNDTLYAEAELEETDTVFLWLGVRSFISPISIQGQP